MAANEKQQAEAAAVAAIIEAGGRIPAELHTIDTKLHDGNQFSFMVVRDQNGGMVPFSIEKFMDEVRDRPRRKKGVAKFTDAASFIAHTNRFKDASSAIFASDDRTAPSLTSILDYHDATGARYLQHRGVYTCPVTEEWKAWHHASGKAMKQDTFAAFIEDHLFDLVEPTGVKDLGSVAQKLLAVLGCTYASPSRLIELSKGLALRVNARIQNQSSTQTGETQFTYVTEHQGDDNTPLKVPQAFLVGISVFKNGPVYVLPVRLRYRIREAEVMWSFELHGADLVFDEAVTELIQKAEQETSLPVYRGSPEAA